jgi:hypothetical protein
MNAAEEPPDFTQLDDTALLRAREQIRADSSGCRRTHPATLRWQHAMTPASMS